MAIRLNSILASAPMPYPAHRPALSCRRQQQALCLGLCLSDALMLALAFILAHWLRFHGGLALVSDIVPPPGFYPQLVGMLIPLWLGLFSLFGLYDPQYLLGGTAEYARVFNAATAGMMLVVVATFLGPMFVVARAWLIAAWLLSFLLVSAARFWLRRGAYALRRRGYFLAPAVIVGGNEEALALERQLRDWKTSGLRVEGCVLGRRSGLPIDAAPRAPVLGSLGDIEDIIRQRQVEEVVVVITALDREELLELFERVNSLPGVNLRLSTGLFEVLTTGAQVRTWGCVPLVSPNALRLEPIEAATKTVLDYALTLLTLALLLPCMALIAVLIKLDSPGPVFYRRRVVGANGAHFDAFKFRTMVVCGEETLAQYPQLLHELRTKHKLKDDPRVTRIGRWLRRTSLDELPQLFNVLWGQMSLVGPRMITLEEIEKYGRMRRNLLTVKPGITGLWQVSGRSDLSYEERVRLDMLYLRNYTIWLDLQILFIQTLPAVLKGRGAY